MKELGFEKIYPWFLLNFEARSIVERVLSEWNKLLSDTSNKESVYHQFLAEHAGLFFSNGNNKIPVLSKLRLGAEYETDFIITHDRRSWGLEYGFIEIETPHAAPFTASGNPSARLTHSIQQVLNWQNWLQANRPQAKKLFPSKQFTIQEEPNFSFFVYIGTRSSSDDFLYLRNRYARKLGIEIHTFDSLTYFLENRSFALIPSIQMDWVDIYTQNQLSNPFFKAYSDKKWRKIVSGWSLSPVHMMRNNAKLLLKHREYNSLFEEFISIWNGLSSDRRDHHIETMKLLT